MSALGVSAATSVVVILWCVAALIGVAVCAILAKGRAAATAFVYTVSFVVTAVATAIALSHLLEAPASPAATVLPAGLAWTGAHFRIDALAAFFLVVVNLGGAAASLYGLGYGRHETAPERVLPFYPAFLAGMNLVVIAADAFTFLLSWEFMSLASWALVVAHHHVAENIRAGTIYLLMASFGTLALLLAFGLLAGAEGTYVFSAIAERGAAPPVAALVLALVLIGTGSKAGLVPLHVWLPLAHPAAPNHVSALMSGVMTKVAVYGFIRIVFDLLGPPVWWWSMLVLGLAGITAVLGVLYALMQHDLKRLLAYHTVENIGIIFIGLGLALAFEANGLAVAAALAFTAALFHVLNHSVFKSLLFFGSGAVLSATGERDMEHLGGLIHRMPQTAFAFLVGSAAISALPPLNGFVSEWLTFQAILLSPALPQWGLRLLIPAVGAMLALSAALAAACFVKAFGVSFLGRPRSRAAARAREVDGFSIAAMLGLAALCVAGGVLPGVVMDALGPVARDLVGGQLAVRAPDAWLPIVPIAESRSSYNGLVIFALVAGAVLFAAAAIRIFGTGAARRSPAWDCGFPDPSPATQYSATSFAQPIRRVFGGMIFAAREQVEMPRPGEMRPARLRVALRDPVWEMLYAPIGMAVSRAADRLNPLQFLTIRRYLGLVFFALLSVLMVLALWP